MSSVPAFSRVVKLVGGTDVAEQTLSSIFSPFSQNITDTAFLFDVDDCFVPATVRRMDDWKKRMFWDLHDLTNGAVALVTNSDMRGIDEMLPGFPCVSEHGSLFRLEKNGTVESIAPKISSEDIIEYLAAPFDFNGINTTSSASELHGDAPVLKVEAKQASVALVFGKHETLRKQAIFLLEQAREVFGLDGHEVVAGKDAVELVPIGFAKHHALDKIMRHPNFVGRTPHIIGDSRPDGLFMQAAFESYGGQGYSVGDNFPKGFEKFIAKHLRDTDHVAQHFLGVRDLFVRQKQMVQGLKTTPVPR